MPHNSLVLIEDVADAADLFRYACDKAGLSHSVRVLESFSDALSYLSKYDGFDQTDAPAPALVVLDVNTDAVGCFGLLRWIRSRPSLNNTSAIILSASEDAKYMRVAYEAGANSYIVKPSNLDEYVRLFRSIRKLWIGGSREQRFAPCYGDSEPEMLNARAS